MPRQLGHICGQKLELKCKCVTLDQLAFSIHHSSQLAEDETY